MAHGDDITTYNQTMPHFGAGTPLWHRILCVLGYHRMEVRRAHRDHKGGGGLDLGGMRLRDQCGRCGVLSNERQIPDDIAEKLAPHPKGKRRG